MMLAMVVALASAQVPHKIGYHGLLLKADGRPETGTVSMKFSVYDADTNGAELWSETQSVALSDGSYATDLGAVTALPDTVFTGPERFLEALAVNGSALQPRMRLSSVPYALTAGAVKGAVDATSIRVGGTEVISSSGVLVGPAALPTCAAGEILRWGTGNRWSCSPLLESDAGLATYVADPTGGLAQSGAAFSLIRTCAAGQLLQWDGGEWACASLKASDIPQLPYIENQELTVQTGGFAVTGEVVAGRLSAGGTPAAPSRYGKSTLTWSPKLTVSGDSSGGLLLTGQDREIGFAAATADGGSMISAEIAAVAFGPDAGLGLWLMTMNGTDPIPQPRVVIAPSGNVGVGVLSPTAPLDVQGAIQVTDAVGALSISGTRITGVNVVALDVPGGPGAELNVYPNRVMINGRIDVLSPMELNAHDPSWGTGSAYPTWLRQGRNPSTTGDFLYLGAVGDRSNTAQSAMVLSQLLGTYWGTGADSANGLTNTQMRLDAAGNLGVGLGLGAVLDCLHVNGNIRADCLRSQAGALITGTCSSDARLKKNVTPLEPMLSRLSQLKPVRYDWRTDEFPDRHLGTERAVGLIAQDVERALPELVVTNPDGFKAVHFEQLPVLLLQGERELGAKVTRLEAENRELKARLAAIERRLGISPR